MARCEENLGRLRLALGLYKLAAAEASAGGPELAETAREAEAAQKRLQREIPRVRVAPAPGETLSGAKVSLDGSAWPDLTAVVEVDPGEHVVEAVREARTFRTTISVERGRESVVEVRFPAIAVGPPPSSPGLLVGGIVSMSVGGAALVLGGVALGVRQSAIGTLEDLCSETSCPSDAEPARDRGELSHALMIAGFVTGGVGLAIGIPLTIVGVADSAGPSEPSASAMLRIGPAASYLEVRFP
jgi:hypothetical protein